MLKYELLEFTTKWDKLKLKLHETYIIINDKEEMEEDEVEMYEKK